MGKMEQESQRFSRLLLGKANRKHICTKRGCGSLFAQHLLLMELLLWRKLLAFGEIFGMKADIDEINEQLTIRTDYESDMNIERVSDLSEKFAIEVNYEAEVKILGLGFFVKTSQDKLQSFPEDGECELSWKPLQKNRI
jgi:hypothetical protein